MAGITGAFTDPSSAQANGIHVGGIKYIYNKTEEVDKVPILHAAKVFNPFPNAYPAWLRKYRAKKVSLQLNAPDRSWLHTPRSRLLSAQQYPLSKCKLNTLLQMAAKFGLSSKSVRGDTALSPSSY
jgi:hypothetical protein